MSTLLELAPSPRLAYRVWRRNFRVFGKLWKGSLAPQFIDPVFYLLAMGFGLGKYLTHVDGLTFTAVVGKIDYYSYYYTLFITPMFLFSGLFYPLTRLPDWVHVAAWFTPLYHLVNLTRGLALGPDLGDVAGNALWLIVLIAVLFPIPVRAMRRRLVA